MINYCIFENNFGVIEDISDTEDAEKRDMGKPVRRNELAIPPRLAKILINLSGVKENQTLADPFCGIGVILQEALLNGIDVIGIDRDKKAIENCSRNLKWLEKNYSIKSRYRLINNDSKTVRLSRIDAVACEPNLGKVLKKAPKKHEALQTLEHFEILLIAVLNNMKRYLNYGKIAFTAPSIQAGGSRISCNIQKIMHRTGLKLADIDVDFPLKEERDGQLVAREIYVLEKA
jgi:tRNA G10  N-methylase Trm11